MSKIKNKIQGIKISQSKANTYVKKALESLGDFNHLEISSLTVDSKTKYYLKYNTYYNDEDVRIISELNFFNYLKLLKLGLRLSGANNIDVNMIRNRDNNLYEIKDSINSNRKR